MRRHSTIPATVPTTANAWGRRARHARSEGGNIVKTVRLDHLRAALLAVAAAGLLAAVGLVVVLYAQPSEANYPGKPGKIVYAEEHGNNFVIYTIKANGKGKLRLTAKGANNREPAYGPGGNGWPIRVTTEKTTRSTPSRPAVGTGSTQQTTPPTTASRLQSRRQADSLHQQRFRRRRDLHDQGRRGKQAQHHQKFHGRPVPFLLAFR